jgi:glyceraldehyde-3-phosphate dehydrogenase (NAD(P))|tara:strand:- start:41295 stop:42305 length:1011 start_codon:yes stop_codon:yes gene_type:complete
MIKVGIVGYGTIGKRVADAVAMQKDMKLTGVTAHSYSFNTEVANEKGYKIFTVGDDGDLKLNGIKPAGDINNLLEEVDIIVDATPKKVGKENIEKYYKPKKVKAIIQGGEKHETTGTSFVAQCNYDEALNKDFVRIVSCNTTGLCRTLHALNKFDITSVHATLIRRGADPGDIRHGPINAVVPVLEMPSHHGPDVRSVLPKCQIFTTALSVPSTLMHVHTVIADVKKKVNVDDVIDALSSATRIRIVRNAEHLRSTAEIIEFARDLGRQRGDMPEICVWKEAIGAVSNGYNKLLYMQAVHQESDVVPENIDCIRAMTGFKDGQKSIEMTNKSFGIK